MNLLFVSIAFPPKKDPECVQTGRYFKYLTEFDDLSIEVLTSASPTLFMPEDDLLKRYDQGWKHKVELGIFENKYVNFIQRKLGVERFNLPDTKAHFHRQWKKGLKQLKQKPDIIYSRSNPLSSAYMAYHLSEYFKVPWVFHLSDPWVDSPLHEFSERQKAHHELWEKRCFSKSAAICLTSEKSIKFYKNKYPDYADKIEFFPNVYDRIDIQDNPYHPKEKLRIVYSGGLAGTRSPKSFLMALQRFNQIESDHQMLEVIFAGPTDRKMKSIIDSYALPNFTYLGNLSFQDSLSLQKTADALLIIDSPIDSPHLSMFFPSKILEYFTSKRRIFALTTPDSSTEKVMNESGFDSLDLKDTETIAEYLVEMLDHYKQGDKDYFLLDNIPEQYDAGHNAGRLHQIFKSL